MRMRSAELVRWSVRSAKRDWDIKLPARHREHVWRVVDHLIECDQREAERHELNDGPQAHHRRADPEPSESVFADWSIDDAFWTKPL